MITVTLEDGGKFDLPAQAILLLEESETGKKGCTIVFTLQEGQNSVEKLKDAYGFVKKKWNEGVLGLPLQEVTVVAPEGNHKLTFPEHSVVARRELTNDETGAKTRLTLNVNGRPITVNVADSRDSLITGE